MKKMFILAIVLMSFNLFATTEGECIDISIRFDEIVNPEGGKGPHAASDFGLIKATKLNRKYNKMLDQAIEACVNADSESNGVNVFLREVEAFDMATVDLILMQIEMSTGQTIYSILDSEN